RRDRPSGGALRLPRRRLQQHAFERRRPLLSLEGRNLAAERGRPVRLALAGKKPVFARSRGAIAQRLGRVNPLLRSFLSSTGRRRPKFPWWKPVRAPRAAKSAAGRPSGPAPPV